MRYAKRTVVTGILVYFTGAVAAWVVDSFARGCTLFGAISFASYVLFAMPFVYLAFLRRKA